MSLILKDKIPSLMKGYPTVSDKYDVRGATLSSESTEGHFGDIIVYDTENAGFFKVAETITSETDVAGVLLATNVKLITDFFNGSSMNVTTKPGEAFNLMTKGFVAMKLIDNDGELSKLTIGENVGVSYIGAGVCATTTERAVSMSNWYYTGTSETLDDGTILVEIEIR